MFRVETPWVDVVCRVGGSVGTVRVVTVSYGGVLLRMGGVDMVVGGRVDEGVGGFDPEDLAFI
eukprot:3124853-Heterocapsa_arctica.AAC.1